MEAWRRKAQRDIARRVSTTTNADWAAALCRVLIWYGEKHPEAGIDVEHVAHVLSRRVEWHRVTIRRDKSGFTAETWFPIRVYHTVTNRGLPPIPTAYKEE